MVRVTTDNQPILSAFIKDINDNHFRYYNTRTIDCIQNHVITLLFYDMINDICVGYTHIDYSENDNKHWFGIYINENYRAQRLGSILLDYTINHSALNKIKDVSLTVDITNTVAIKLYTKHNFIVEKYNEKTINMYKNIN